ncbi:SLC13 family permease [Enterocloster bolteae]|uniref:SLC13 family permease n=1 Tax=Enterocloster bolteae TaxID=208479 RepID=UPI003AEFFEBD
MEEKNLYTEYTVGLMDPMKARLPMLIMIVIYCILIAPRLAPDKPSMAMGTLEAKKDNREVLPPFQEKCGYIIFILVTAALMLQSKLGIPTWIISFVGAIAMVMTGVLTEKEEIANINLSIAFLFVGSLAMGGALAQTGAGEAVGAILAGVANKISNPYLIGLVFFIVPFLLTQIMMNRTVMLIFIPITILACKSMGANPVGMTILVQSGCLSSFMTPMATPAVSMCMAVGGYDLKSVIKQSILPAALLCVISVGWIMTVFPLF